MIVVRHNDIRDFQHIAARICRREADAGLLEHRQVILTVADRADKLRLDIHVLCQAPHAVAFMSALTGHFIENRRGKGQIKVRFHRVNKRTHRLHLLMRSRKVDFSPLLTRLRNGIEGNFFIRNIQMNKMLARDFIHIADIGVIEQKHLYSNMRKTVHDRARKLLGTVIQSLHVHNFLRAFIAQNRTVEVNPRGVARKKPAVCRRCRTGSSGCKGKIAAIFRKIFERGNRFPSDRAVIIEQRAVHIARQQNSVKFPHIDTSISVIHR